MSFPLHTDIKIASNKFSQNPQNFGKILRAKKKNRFPKFFGKPHKKRKPLVELSTRGNFYFWALTSASILFVI